MSTPVTVVKILSISYTGTTWINTVLGSHPRGIALGPPDRFFQLKDADPDRLCLIHGTSCAFWPPFLRAYGKEVNFFEQLASFADRDFVVINNPIPDGMGQELESPRVKTITVYVVRDGRAVTASYARKMGMSFEQALTDWYKPATDSFQIPGNAQIIRYEDFVSDPEGILARLEPVFGWRYSENAIRYWEYDHHLISGNQGLMAMLRLHQGIPIANFESREFYERQYERIVTDPSKAVMDLRWREQVTADDRALFDTLCGSHNASFGYGRDGADAVRTSDKVNQASALLRRVHSKIRRLVGRLPV